MSKITEKYLYEGIARLCKEKEIDDTTIVYDGDTFDVFVSTWHDSFSKETVRLRGVDTKELYGENHKDAVTQTNFTKKWLDSNEEKSPYHYPFIVRNYGEDSFGRIIADIIDRKSDNILNEDILNEFENVKYKE